MSALNWGMGIIALFACGAAAYIILEQPFAITPPSSPSLSMVVPRSIEANQPFDVQIFATRHAGETIVLTANEKTYSYLCKENECTYTLSLSLPSGDHTLFLQSPTQFSQLPIHVSFTQSVCIDGTPEGECSLPPSSLRCMNHTLILDCSTCGCPNGMICENNACVQPPLSFSIVIQTDWDFYTTSSTPVMVTIANTGSYPVTGFFLVELESQDAGSQPLKTFPQQIKLEKLSPNEMYSVSIPIQLSSSTQKILAHLYHSTTTNPKDQWIGDSSPFSVTVQTDTTPPGPPTQFSYHSAENGYILTWEKSPSPDVSQYIVYQQNLATGGFTTYSILGQTSETQYLVPMDGGGKAYTLKSKDFAGNESPATQPLVIAET